MKSKIVIVRTSGNFLDIEKYNCQELGLAKELIKNNYCVTLILAGNKNESRTLYFNDASIDLIYVKSIGVHQSLSYFLNFKKLLDLLKPDILQVHDLGNIMSFLIVRYAKINSIPVCLIQGAYEVTRRFFKKQLEEFFNKTLGVYTLRNVKSIGCKTHYAKEYVLSIKSDVKQVAITPIGLDTYALDNPIGLDFDIRERIGYSTDDKVLLYIGKLERRRDPLFLIDLLKSLDSTYKLIVVGDGELKSALIDSIIEAKIESRCFYLGVLPQSKLRSVYEISDLFLLPTDYEIYGMVILESMYNGVPVISTLNAGSDLLIRNQLDGLILDKQLDLWVENIIKLTNDRTKLNFMKRESLRRVNDSFTWSKTVFSFIDLYKTIINKR